MKTKLEKISPKELVGTSYKGYAVKSTVSILTEALGVEPSVFENGVCEWYLEHNGLVFSLYNENVLDKDSVLWFRIGTYTKLNSIETHDIITHMLKAS